MSITGGGEGVLVGLSGWEREREMGALRRAGLERREARTFVIWEWLVLALKQKAPEVIVWDLVLCQ